MIRNMKTTHSLRIPLMFVVPILIVYAILYICAPLFGFKHFTSVFYAGHATAFNNTLRLFCSMTAVNGIGSPPCFPFLRIGNEHDPYTLYFDCKNDTGNMTAVQIHSMEIVQNETPIYTLNIRSLIETDTPGIYSFHVDSRLAASIAGGFHYNGEEKGQLNLDSLSEPIMLRVDMSALGKTSTSRETVNLIIKKVTRSSSGIYFGV